MNARSLITRFFKGIPNFLTSVVKYVKSSILSIVVLAIIFFLLTKMEQAASMVIDLVEHDLFSLLLSLIFINVLAFSLSHYPIYTYYAANLNENSKKVFFWEPRKIFGLVTVTVFKPEFKENYKFDIWANVLRYTNGMLLFVIWGCILIYGFERNLRFDDGIFTAKGLYWMVAIFGLLALFFYGLIRNKKFGYKEAMIQASLGITPKIKNAKEKNHALNAKVSLSFLIVSILFILSIIGLCIVILMGIGFSKLGLFLLLFSDFCLLLLYFIFRILRQEFHDTIDYLKQEKKHPLVRHYLNLFRPFHEPHWYLGILFVTFLTGVVFILCTHFMAISGMDIANGIPILFAYLYCYSYMIFSIFKFFFVTRKSLKHQYKKGTFNEKRYVKWRWIIGSSVAMFLMLLWVGSWDRTEGETHQLSMVESGNTDFTQEKLVEDIRNKEDSVVYFIAAQGGGLKGNFWTLNVLNKLQKMTDGQLMNRTIAMSGASGGSLGLGLYTSLYRSYHTNTDQIQRCIDTISLGNYTSVDLSLMFGWDFLRNTWPLNVLGGNKDRAYYKMCMYQDMIEGKAQMNLDTIGFRALWNETYAENNYFPSLIMNTSSKSGRRGIFWSHQVTGDFKSIFPNAIDLLNLEDGKVIPFYEAISTTNRFPLLSPAAKIKGKGHFIDAGAIDNGGLMGCLDIYRFLKNEGALEGKRVVFIEIMNGGSSYTNHLIDSLGFEPHVNEEESSTLESDLAAGVNLDKMPDYLSGLVYNMSENSADIDYVPIFLPHRTSLADIEERLGGTLEDSEYPSETIAIEDLLAIKNTIIRDRTECRPRLCDPQKDSALCTVVSCTPQGSNKGFAEPWKYMEPPLSRHLSRSNIAYGKQMLRHPDVDRQFQLIKALDDLNR